MGFRVPGFRGLGFRVGVAILHDLKDPQLWEHGNYGRFLIRGSAGFVSSVVSPARAFWV